MANSKGTKKKINAPQGFDDLAAVFSEGNKTTEEMVMGILVDDPVQKKESRVEEKEDRLVTEIKTGVRKRTDTTPVMEVKDVVPEKKVIPQEKAVRGAAAGCKVGSTRHTYVMPYDMIEKLKAIAGYFSRPEVSIVLEILDNGIQAYEKKYGKQVSNLMRSPD